MAMVIKRWPVMVEVTVLLIIPVVRVKEVADMEFLIMLPLWLEVMAAILLHQAEAIMQVAIIQPKVEVMEAIIMLLQQKAVMVVVTEAKQELVKGTGIIECEFSQFSFNLL